MAEEHGSSNPHRFRLPWTLPAQQVARRDHAASPLLWRETLRSRLLVFALVFAVWTALCLTDGVDGYLARRHGTTRSGAFLDPLADKVLVLGAMWALVASNRFAVVPVILITVRELGSTLRIARTIADVFMSVSTAIIDYHVGDWGATMADVSYVADYTNAEIAARSKAMALAYGFPVVHALTIFSGLRGARTSLGHAGERFGIPGIVAEVGGLGFGEPHESRWLQANVAGTRGVMCALGILPGQLRQSDRHLHFFEYWRVGPTTLWIHRTARSWRATAGRSRGWRRRFRDVWCRRSSCRWTEVRRGASRCGS